MSPLPTMYVRVLMANLWLADICQSILHNELFISVPATNCNVFLKAEKEHRRTLTYQKPKGR